MESLPVWPPPEPPDSWTHKNPLGVAEVDAVVMGGEEGLVMDAVKKEGKETYPCREVESEWWPLRIHLPGSQFQLGARWAKWLRIPQVGAGQPRSRRSRAT